MSVPRGLLPRREAYSIVDPTQGRHWLVPEGEHRCSERVSVPNSTY